MAVLDSSQDRSGNLSGGVLTVNADMLPDNFEIKSVDITMNYGDKWSPSIVPFNNLYFTYDNQLKQIYIGKTNFFHNVPLVGKPAPLPSLVLGVRDYRTSPMNSAVPFARVYMTW
jgi:hypothetical protein